MAVIVECSKRNGMLPTSKKRKKKIMGFIVSFLSKQSAKRKQLFKKYNAVEILSAVASNSSPDISSDAKQTLYVLTWTD